MIILSAAFRLRPLHTVGKLIELNRLGLGVILPSIG
jgi:hypothetical protein